MSLDTAMKVRGEMEAIVHLLEGAVGRLDDYVTEEGLAAQGQQSLPLDGEKGRLEASAPGEDAPVGVTELETEIERLRDLLAELHRLARDAQWAAVMRKLEAEISGVTEGGTAAA
jgi:hypothetical protein